MPHPLNRLAHEKSPYLLQHSRNPVDWYPWGEEAFARARAEGKPIFLSIGYSTCHWCHVMERESFEQEDVARVLNAHFVSIKVDREERPDIDHIYMTFCQAMTGQGGWPLTAILTPDRRPFFAGTYIPSEPRYGRPGLKDLLYQIASAWESQNDRVLESAASIMEAMRDQFTPSPGGAIGPEVLEQAFAHLDARFDEEHAGFGGAPKFPTPHQLTFLLRYWVRTANPRALALVERTLQAMRRGGIYDHLGFGFHRYSTDRSWHVPHFEKMLYDQALLLIAYSEAYHATRNVFYGGVAREIATYVFRDLTSPDGGFYSAEDADSEGVEGKFYLWRRDEIEEILGRDASLFCRAYKVEADGNWHDEGNGESPDTNILHLVADLASIATPEDAPIEIVSERLESARKRLLEARSSRTRPLRDDKILTSWNGLMIAALARASSALGDPRLAEAAARAARFIDTHLTRDDDRLYARFRDGEAAHLGYLDDYAFYAWGLVELYDATFEARHLLRALEAARAMIRLFRDGEHGGFFFTAEDGEPLIARPKEASDGAVPSGNSIAALVLLRLARLTGDAALEESARQTLGAFSESVSRHPHAYTQLLQALEFELGPSREIVIAGDPAAPGTAALIGEVRRRYLPRAVLLLHEPGERGDPLRAAAPRVAGLTPRAGRAAAYVCERFACREPVSDAASLAALLDS